MLRWRDDRLRAVAPGTVAREMGVFGSVLTWARKERQIPLAQNPDPPLRRPQWPMRAVHSHRKPIGLPKSHHTSRSESVHRQ
ncbi:MAG: hypothetical protein JSS41_03765 [Proteobacteria bacterium]|nr:hypothetical protein [Pseudomonadota bacterium]